MSGCGIPPTLSNAGPRRLARKRSKSACDSHTSTTVKAPSGVARVAERQLQLLHDCVVLVRSDTREPYEQTHCHGCPPDCRDRGIQGSQDECAITMAKVG